ncbi:histidine phosphatase family protein [Bradyrhizobium sp. HKCCYLS20291]|uniref:histidine phosphatase family protein n=1 Tax=Bradyrhizobium sp. HKCCYLS20291 TaxID=3420766 RepID=UPI003EBB1CBA
MKARLHLICAAATPATAAMAFPADEPLDARGRDSIVRLVGRLPSHDAAQRSPARSAADTAEALALDAQTEPALRDCDFGRWAGRSLAEVQAETPEGVAAWLRDPHAAPHGGESFTDVTTRVAGWMESLLAVDSSVLAITHATVMRAAIAQAIGAGPAAFRRIDVAPLTRARLSAVGGRWTLAALVPLKDER